MVETAIGHYIIGEKLGEGGMGVVHKAEDSRLRRTVALKFLSNRALQDPELKELFLQEAQAAAALDHPNICTVHAIEEIEGRLELAVTQGILSEYEVTVPLVADIDPADKAVRNLPDVNFTGVLAGAIHTVEIAGTISV